VRNKDATRPWQHVLDPLSGYLTLGAALWQIIDAKTFNSAQANEICSAFNFGPNPESNRPVRSVVDEVLKHWPGEWIDRSDASAPHEAGLLNLNIEKAERLLQWRPVWDFQDAVARTVSWYRGVNERADPLTLTRTQIEQFQCDAAAQALRWAR
jgi:CDP-glucose 4,6-dehydratase